MKISKQIFSGIIVLVLCFSGMHSAGFAESQDKGETAAEKPGDIAQLIIGKWTIKPNDVIVSGTIFFKSDSWYVMDEKRSDGTGVSKKGEYRLNVDATPVTIDMCLQGCDEPGSEWTTVFGLIRMISDGKMELFMSETGKYPAAFPSEPDPKATIILTK